VEKEKKRLCKKGLGRQLRKKKGSVRDKSGKEWYEKKQDFAEGSVEDDCQNGGVPTEKGVREKGGKCWDKTGNRE